MVRKQYKNIILGDDMRTESYMYLPKLHKVGYPLIYLKPSDITEEERKW